MDWMDIFPICSISTNYEGEMNILKTIPIMTLAFFLVACDDNNPREAQIKQLEQKRVEREKSIETNTAAIERQYNAIRFPPKVFKNSPFTYVIQKYFEEHRDKLHLFSGSVTDIVKDGENYRAYIQIQLGGNFLGELIRLELNVAADKLKKLPIEVNTIRRLAILREYIWVIAQIKSVDAVPRLATFVVGDRDYVSTESDNTRLLTIVGELVDFFKK